MSQRIYRHVSFEFDDPSVSDTHGDLGEVRALTVDATSKTPEVESATCLVSHRHEQDRVVSVFGFTYIGSTKVVSEGWVLARSTTALMCWFREQRGTIPQPSRVELTESELGPDPAIQSINRDITLEARTVIQRLAVFLNGNPGDFKI